MEKERMIKQLEDLAEHCESMIDKTDQNSVWRDDTEALKEAMAKFSTECTGNDAQGVIRAILAKEGISQQQLADKTGMVRQNVSQMLTRGEGMRYSSFQKMVDALGYEIILRKK